MKPRARQLGLNFPGTTGPNNAITDVPGITVGFCNINQTGDSSGQPKIQTGVTAIHPQGHLGDSQPPNAFYPQAPARAAYFWAGQHTLNGNGEMTGCQWIHDAGYFMGPICITNTHAVGMTHHASMKWMIEHYPDFFHREHRFAMPVVAETFDGILNDINGLHVKEKHVFEALNSAQSGPVAEGNSGGGNGMITYEFKGGTGTSSREITLEDKTYTLGVLVQSNFGSREDLTVLGVPVGQHLTGDKIYEKAAVKELGSIIVIIATDAPLIPSQLTRIAKRATLGLARTGTIGGHGSGDIFLAFTTANAWEPGQQTTPTTHREMLGEHCLNEFYRAARDATEESIINAMVAGESTVAFRPQGAEVKAIDHEALMALIKS